MDIIQLISSIVAAIATVVAAIIAGIYTRYSIKLWEVTKRTADIAERNSDITQKIFEAAYRPYVGVYEVNFEVVNGNLVHIEIKIKNSGTVIASNILIEVNSFHNQIPFGSGPPEIYSDVLIPGCEFMKDIAIKGESFRQALSQKEEIIVAIKIHYSGLTDTIYGSDAIFAFTPDITAFTGKGRKEYIVSSEELNIDKTKSLQKRQ
jgi:hypothetical protein